MKKMMEVFSPNRGAKFANKRNNLLAKLVNFRLMKHLKNLIDASRNLIANNLLLLLLLLM